MNSLIRLLSVDVPSGTKLQSAELHFRGLIPWWAGVGLLVLLGAIVVYFYLKERAKLSVPTRLALAALRIGLFAILLFLLCRPLLLAEFEGQRSRGVVFLLDNSQSMLQQDRRLAADDKARVAIALGKVPPATKLPIAKLPDLPKDPSRAALVKGVLQNQDLRLLAGLREVGPLRTYLFGSGVRGLQEEGERDDPVQRLSLNFKANETKTALADAIHEVLQKKDGDLPAAIVVVTDGRDNSSKYELAEAAEEASRLGVPLHVYGVGAGDSGSLQIKEVGAPSALFAEDTAQVPIIWRSQGLTKGTLEISVTLGGKTVAKRELPVQPGEAIRETLSFVVPKGKEAEETLKLTTTIRLKGNDQYKDTLTKETRLVDKKIRVLYVEHAPRFEYKFMQAALLRDRRVDATFVLVNADPMVANSGPPFLPEFPKQRDKFFEGKYNVIILGDVSPKYLGKDQLEWIQEFVANRGGLIVISGRQYMPSGYEGTPLAEVLPVEFNQVKAKLPTDDRSAEYPPTLSEAGLRTEMFALADLPEESLKIWRDLPGFYWQYPVTKLRPGAQSLIVNPRSRMGDQPMPLFASQYYGKGQVLFAGTDETWRWRANAENKHFIRFWGQVLYQMGLPSLLGSTSSRVQVALDRSEAMLDRPGSVFVRLLDKDFNPRKDAQVEAVLEYIDAKPGQERTRKITLNAIGGRDGEYQALLMHDKPGRFELRVNNPDPTWFSFRVELPPHHELEESGLAEKELRDLAEQSGGKFYREEDLHRLASSVRPQQATFHTRQEILLWNPLMFLVFLGLITLEWVMRKLANLM